MGNLKRFRVRRNGTRIHSCETLSAAKRYIAGLYNSGNVLPDDYFSIFDSKKLRYEYYVGC